jgi:hypothetical protein
LGIKSHYGHASPIHSNTVAQLHVLQNVADTLIRLPWLLLFTAETVPTFSIRPVNRGLKSLSGTYRYSRENKNKTEPRFACSVGASVLLNALRALYTKGHASYKSAAL